MLKDDLAIFARNGGGATLPLDRLEGVFARFGEATHESQANALLGLARRGAGRVGTEFAACRRAVGWLGGGQVVLLGGWPSTMCVMLASLVPLACPVVPLA